MSQVDNAILDALTHVAFPKGFVQAEPSSVVTIDNVTYPVWRADALVVGSGAAGLRGGGASASPAKRPAGDGGPLYGHLRLLRFG